MGNYVEELFGVFQDEKLHESFVNAEIQNVRIAMEQKSVEIDVFFPVLVTYKTIEKAQEYLKKALDVFSVSVFPKMPAECF